MIPEEQKTRIKKYACLWIGLDSEESNPLFELALDTVIQESLNYCNRDDVPEAMELVVAKILWQNWINEFPSGSSSSGSESNGVVTSIKRGDTQINFSDAKSSATAFTQKASFNRDDRFIQLNRFRRLGVLK